MHVHGTPKRAACFSLDRRRYVLTGDQGTIGWIINYLRKPRPVVIMRMRSLASVTLAALLSSSSAHAQVGERGPIQWRTFEVPELGTRVQVPASSELRPFHHCRLDNSMMATYRCTECGLLDRARIH
jgi:hypothetical protein